MLYQGLRRHGISVRTKELWKTNRSRRCSKVNMRSSGSQNVVFSADCSRSCSYWQARSALSCLPAWKLHQTLSIISTHYAELKHRDFHDELIYQAIDCTRCRDKLRIYTVPRSPQNKLNQPRLGQQPEATTELSRSEKKSLPAELFLFKPIVRLMHCFCACMFNRKCRIII